MAQSKPVVVIGGGLSGLSAAHTLLEQGLNVVLIDKKAFMGGNSVKATSGINGAGTPTQAAMGVPDTKEIFEEDTVRSATGQKTGPKPPTYALARVLTHNSADAVRWCAEKFNLTLDTVSRLGGHSHPRTHRSKSGDTFPGMMITYALMEKYTEICETQPDRAKFINRARANKLLTDANGKITGVQYEVKGQNHTQDASAVIITTGGYAAGCLYDTSLLHKVRPELTHLPTTNGDHCTGDGIMMAQEIGGADVDLTHVQVHPTGLVNPSRPDDRTKFLAAGALRGQGGIMINKEGHRFCNELGTRDYCTGKMWENKRAPYRLILNKAAAASIAWHCKHYRGRGVMKLYNNGYELAKDMGISSSVLAETFRKYNEDAERGTDEFKKKYFNNWPVSMDEELNVGIVTPVLHYTMGGLKIDEHAAVMSKNGGTIPGLFAGGEAAGGVHGRNRLGGSALLECVVFGRVAGDSAAKFVKTGGVTATGATGGVSVTVTVQHPNGTVTTVQIGGGNGGASPAPASSGGSSAGAPTPATPSSIPPKEDSGSSGATEEKGSKTYTLAEVAKHNTDGDAWVVVNGKVLDVTNFVDDHPGGKMAIMTFAGRDASEEFNMLHEKNVVEKFAPETIIGDLAPQAKL